MAARIAAQHDAPAQHHSGIRPVREVPSTRSSLLREFGDLMDHAEVPGG